MNKTKRIWIAVAAVAALALIILGMEALLSMTNYRVMKGIFGSEMVGSKNYAQFFRSAASGSILKNSLVLRLLEITLAAVLSLGGCALVHFVPSAAAKRMIGGVGLLLAVLPASLYIQLFQAHKVVEPDGFSLAYLSVTCLPKLGLGIFAGSMLALSRNIPWYKGALVAPLTLALSILSPNLRAVYAMQNSLNMRSSDILESYVYRIGFMNAQFSMSAAVSVLTQLINTVIGLIPALVLGGIICHGMPQRKRKVYYAPAICRKQGLTALIGCAGFSLVLLVVMGAVSGAFSSFSGTGHALGQTLLQALLTMVIATLVYFGVLICCRDLGRKSWAALGLLALLLSGMGAIKMVNYLFFRSLGMMNTVIPAAISNAFHPTMITLLIVLISLNPKDTGMTLTLAGGAGMLAAAVSAGECFFPMLYTRDTALYNLALFHRGILLNSGANMEGIAANPAGALWLIALIVLVLGSIAAGAIFTRSANAYSELKLTDDE